MYYDTNSSRSIKVLGDGFQGQYNTNFKITLGQVINIITWKQSFAVTCQFHAGKITEPKNSLGWQYEQNQLYKFVKKKKK